VQNFVIEKDASLHHTIQIGRFYLNKKMGILVTGQISFDIIHLLQVELMPHIHGRIKQLISQPCVCDSCKTTNTSLLSLNIYENLTTKKYSGISFGEKELWDYVQFF
jgi:hypothetical protein